MVYSAPFNTHFANGTVPEGLRQTSPESSTSSHSPLCCFEHSWNAQVTLTPSATYLFLPGVASVNTFSEVKKGTGAKSQKLSLPPVVPLLG